MRGQRLPFDGKPVNFSAQPFYYGLQALGNAAWTALVRDRKLPSGSVKTAPVLENPPRERGVRRGGDWSDEGIRVRYSGRVDPSKAEDDLGQQVCRLGPKF